MKNLILPCGTSATVTGFNGHAQRILSDLLEDPKGLSPDWLDLVLMQVVRALGGAQRPTPKALLGLCSGSRLRLLIEARRLTYGDKVKFEYGCLRCGAKDQQVTVDLGTLDDVPYPPDLYAYTDPSGMVFTFGWGTGRSEQDFTKGRALKQWSSLDEPLLRVIAVDGQPRGWRWWQDQDAALLDRVRAVGRAMVPVFGEAPTEEPEVLEDDGAWRVPADVPQGGPRERVQIQCGACGHRMLAGVQAQPDFLLRSTLAALG